MFGWSPPFNDKVVDEVGIGTFTAPPGKAWHALSVRHKRAFDEFTSWWGSGLNLKEWD
jgi:hypothetical protein